jgi:iron(III) transport system ATP-binding protein
VTRSAENLALTQSPSVGSHPSAASADDVLVVESVRKRYGDVVALDGVSLRVQRGELLSIVGPSGCGKSTLLRAIAGLTTIDAGRITAGGRVVVGPGVWVPPERRAVGVVFQDLALFPHLSVADNVAFGLPRSRRAASSRRERVAEVLDLVGMSGFAERYPHELSGGEQQRVALARALAPEPDVVLLDEPFSHLDRNLRVQVREHTVKVLRAAGATCVFVTHDQEEALAVGDRVAVARAGQFEQVDVPEHVFHNPATRFVATFVGEADFVTGHADGAHAATPLGRVDLASPAQGAVDVMFRPHEVTFEHVDLNNHQDYRDGANAVVRKVEFRGATVLHELQLDDGETLRASVPHTRSAPIGTRVRVVPDPGHPVAAFERN